MLNRLFIKGEKMIKTLGLVVLYFALGFAEWYLATIRTWAIAQKRALQAAAIAFLEECLGIFVFVYVIFNKDQWWLLIFGVFGGAVGVYIGTRRSK